MQSTFASEVVTTTTSLALKSLALECIFSSDFSKETNENNINNDSDCTLLSISIILMDYR